MWPRAQRSITCLALAACCGCQPVAPSERPESPRATRESLVGSRSHQLLILQLTPTGLSLVAARKVAMPLPTLRTPREESDWRATLEAPGGELLWEDFITVGNRLRGEFRDEGKLEAHHLVRPTAAFPLRLPLSPGTVTLTVRRRSLSPEDPRRAGPGDEWVLAGTVTVSELLR